MAEGYEPRPLDGYTVDTFGSSKHANISEAERASYRSVGRVVIVDLSFTVSTAITNNTEVLFSGLPKNVAPETRFRVPPTYGSNPALRLCVDSDGKIKNQYTNNGIQPGTYEASFAYISQ